MEPDIRLSYFFFSSRRRHARSLCDWSSDVCSSDLVARHAGADHCRVVLRVFGSLLELEVSDNGRGFARGEGAAGMGLVSMRERAEELGGTCEISAVPEGGTRVVARLPLEASGENDAEGPA